MHAIEGLGIELVFFAEQIVKIEQNEEPIVELANAFDIFGTDSRDNGRSLSLIHI